MKKMDKNKKIILTIIAVLILCVGSTLAYIIASLQDEARGNASVTSDAVDILRFEVDKDISLNPTQFNVVEGGDNLSDTAVGSAILRANSTDNNATYNYYVYFQINSNNYIYTTTAQTPEIVLTITDPEGNPVTSISGLDYVTSGGVSGFDITTKSGLYEVAELYEIISNSSTKDTIQEWEFTVSFINLDTNQAENGGKTLEAEIILSRKPVYTLASYITNELYTGTDGENGLYYHDGTGTYGTLEAGDNSYRFSGGDYEIAGSYLGTYSQIYDELVIYNCEGAVTSIGNGACDGSYYFTLDYDTNNTQYTTMKSALEQAVSDGYLTGDNIKNYVCFGSNESPCPEENLYRVIGIFGDQIKLIKADYATNEELGTNGDYAGTGTVAEVTGGYGLPPVYIGNSSDLSTYYWNNVNYSLANQETGYGNVWSYSQLNTVNLNTNYLNSLGITWQNMIEEETWYVGGMDYNSVYSDIGRTDAKTIYDAELGKGKLTSAPFEPYNAKIGLMYVSDYVYGANPEYWGEIDYDTLNPAKTLTSNWLDIGFWDWTVSRISDYSYLAWGVYSGVGVATGAVVSNDFGVRPSFSLSSSALYDEGDGSRENPIRIQNSFVEFDINEIFKYSVEENTTWEEFINSTNNKYNMYINESGNVVNSSGYEILLDGNTVSGADILVNNGSYDANLIAFIIEGMTLYAENGMTWEEYVNSEYNEYNFEIFNVGSNSYIKIMSLLVVRQTDDPVVTTDEVVADFHYILESIRN